jgi:hypothetical protein
MGEEVPARSSLHLSGAATEESEAPWDAGDVAVERVSIDDLLPADSPRQQGRNLDHVKRLMDSDARLPPIIVHRSTMRVIDGMHRLSAAQMRGETSIDVRFFDGSAFDAFVIAVQSNVTHGLPLARADRVAAAKRIITEHPSWSDRLIASVSGLSAGTVGVLRREVDTTSAGTIRIGRDGRQRPMDAAAGRLAASRIVSERPDASLREVARQAGVSPMTVQDVRERIRRGEDPIPARQRAQPTPKQPAAADTGPAGTEPRDHKPAIATIPDIATILDNLVRDPSLRFTDAGRTLLRWLTRHSATLPGWNELAPTVPSHCAYTIAALARQCATQWQQFADELTKRTDTTN